MTREPWMQPAEERGSFRRIPGADRRLSIVSGSFTLRAGSKIELQGSGRALQQIQEQKPEQQVSAPRHPQLPCETPSTNPMTPHVSNISTASRRGSMLGSLKAYYRKLRTFKGTVRALIHLKRTPLSLLSSIKATAPTVSGLSDEQRSVALEVPRISATAASTVQTKVQKLIAEGHVVAEIDSTSGMEVTYRQQGNLDHYTEVNLAKRVSLQQHPHMIALTQRLWNCALRNGEKKLKFSDYETYMLCLHRLILPEFDIAASKELIMDDWKRDSADQDYLDYAFFHLSMFELVDLWTDTVDPEDYISLLYCITHCLTYLLNDRHMLKSLDDVSAVDILEESKGVTLEGIKQDLQRELNSDAFAYYQDQVKLAAEANQRGNNFSNASEHQRQAHSQDNNTSRSRDRKRSSSRDSSHGGGTKDSEHRRSRSGSGASGQDSPKRKFSVQASSKALNLTADTPGSEGNNAGTSPSFTSQTYPAETVPVSPRRETTVQRAISPNVFTRGGGVILNIGMMDGMVISKSIADGKPALPRRRSRSASNSSQHRRDQILQAVSDKVDSTRDASTYSAGLQVSHIEASRSALRTGVQDSTAPGYLLIPSGVNSSKPREPFTVRAAAVAEAAASMAMSAAPVNPRHTFAVQRTQHQRASQSTPEGTALSVLGGATKNIPPNFFINNSSLTAPLMTIVSSKAATPREATSSIKKIQLQFQEGSDSAAPRPQTPYRGFLGASISSPRANNAITADAAGIFLSAQQKPIRPPSSPRHTFVSAPRVGSVMTSDYQAPVSPRKLQQRQIDERLSLLGTSSIPNATSPAVLTINGRLAAHDALQRQSSTTATTPTQLSNSVGAPLLSTSDVDAPVRTAPTQPKDDLKALISPRYIVTNPVVPKHPAPNLKQSSARPQGSARGFAGAKGSPRMRSSLATGPPSNQPQQQRQQRHPSELQRLAIAPGKLG